jgi:LysM repeat protein
MSTLEYIDSFKQSAIKEMHESKVPASITLAQGILESSSGNSRLAKNGNNHFGIKCKKTWTGSVIFEDDDALHECFRAYNNAFESYRDHSIFLKSNNRYAFLFELKPKDYKGWAHGLRKAGYATNKKYGHMLIGLIERYELFKYDTKSGSQESIQDNTPPASITSTEQNLEKEEKRAKLNLYEKKEAIKFTKLKFSPDITNHVLKVCPIRRKNNSFKLHSRNTNHTNKKEHKVQKGESLYSIAMLYNLNPLQLQNINRLQSDAISEGQTILLSSVESPKNNVDEIRDEKIVIKHIVKKGETLYSISRIYKIPVSKIISANNISNNLIQEGQRLKIEH